jgi:tetratricopeptide (TPR) repeat protein
MFAPRPFRQSPWRPRTGYCWLAPRRLLGLSLLIATQLLALPQASPVKIAAVPEPPELTGEPKKVKQLTEAQRQFGEIISELYDENKAKAARPKLSDFIQRHVDYSDAYFLRAMCDLCTLKSRDYASLLKDVEAAISTHSSLTSQTAYANLAPHYSLRAKMRFATGQYREAMDDLEAAMKLDLDSAVHIFNIGGVQPETTSEPCAWSLADLDTMVATFPNDYRVLLFRGLYLMFFTTFKEDYYAKAMQEFEKAAVLNPKSPLPHYFIGKLHTKASFWTKAAWSSDEGRNDAERKAIPAYTKAIQLNPQFLKAYEQRASAYLTLKQSNLAIKDYDKVLELDPENATAYADRGLAKLEGGRLLAATVDLGDAIRRKKDVLDRWLYVYRADAYMQLGDYRNAIADYSKAIEGALANDTFLLNLKQFRGLYPEYGGVSDEALCRKINAVFWPEFEYSEFARRLKENKEYGIGLYFCELYEKRGDAYLRAGDFGRAVLDFSRIFKGIPNLAGTVGRWRLLGFYRGGEEYYVDVKSVEFADNGPARLWLKMVSKKQTYTVDACEVDCKSKRIRQTSSLAYDSDGKLVSSTEASSGWQQIAPDTVGEHLYNGLCPAAR